LELHRFLILLERCAIFLGLDLAFKMYYLMLLS
jgi:hypothetical protein